MFDVIKQPSVILYICGMRFILFFSLFLGLNAFGQSSCSTAVYLKKNKMDVEPQSNEVWYKFRAKGNLLHFKGRLVGSDSLFQYEIYPFSTCEKVEKGNVMPLRSVVKGNAILTQEIWEKFMEDGVCICETCLQKMNTKLKQNLRVKQGEFYLLRVLSEGAPFSFDLTFHDVDSLNPIQFSIDSITPQEMEVGMVYQLKEIFFIPATPNYLPKSLPELKRLEVFLKKYEVLKVQVRGHVNGPAQTKPSFYQSLSDERAQTIKKFLVENGVKEDRVDARGMSNFQMRYPSPKNAFEAAENRRVEIVLTAVE